MNILLVEADYKNKYPPLALMKISAYHKSIGDSVVFVKGMNKELKDKKWDRIYITTLFTFYWNKTIKTIEYYYHSVTSPSNIHVGGILATLLYEDLSKSEKIQGITIRQGLLDKPRMLGNENIPIDRITPDYDIVNKDKNKYLNYDYEVSDAYITSTTKGCIRKCKFCAVNTLEPSYCNYIDIKSQIQKIDLLYGEKRNLMLMDNNILASPMLKTIIDDLVELGFERGNKNYTKMSNGRKLHLTRYVDFNQGIDGRLLTEDTMAQLSRIEIKPLRIAFDHADEENIKIYKNAQWLAAKYGFKNLSNYVLFNFHDNPNELYIRLKINIELNEQFEQNNYKTSIWSFPMKYMPFEGEHRKDRKYIGEYWNAKLLRGIQCILNATHGVVGPKKDFFYHAFGKDFNEFYKIINMPEDYIINRKENQQQIARWNTLFEQLNSDDKSEFINLIANNVFPPITINNPLIQELYNCYL